MIQCVNVFESYLDFWYFRSSSKYFWFGFPSLCASKNIFPLRFILNSRKLKVSLVRAVDQLKMSLVGDVDRWHMNKGDGIWVEDLFTREETLKLYCMLSVKNDIVSSQFHIPQYLIAFR